MGATFGYDKDVDNYDAYFEELKFLGANFIRTWETHENTARLLDAAERYGIKPFNHHKDRNPCDG